MTSREDVRLRNVTSAQIADLIRIGDETNLSPWTAQNYLDELQTPNSIMIASEAAGHTIGFIVGRIVPGATGNDAEIYNIAVIASEQGQGLGQMLFDDFLSKARLSEIENVWLEVRESNAKAIRFYSRNGFEKVQTRPDFYKDPLENAILMRLSVKKQTA